MGASNTDTGRKARAATDTAKKEGQELAQQTANSAGQVVQTAKQEASAVVQEATSEARGLVSQARTEVNAKFDDRRQRLAGALRTSGQEMSRFAGGEGQSTLTKELAQRAGNYAQNVGDYLERADAGRILGDVRSFARRRPGAFLLIAALGGVVAGRLTRGMMAGQSSGSAGQSSGSSGNTDRLANATTPNTTPPDTTTPYTTTPNTTMPVTTQAQVAPPTITPAPPVDPQPPGLERRP